MVHFRLFPRVALWVAVALASGPSLAGDAPDLSTPRRALRHFITAARSGNYASAARALDANRLPVETWQAESGTYARRLKFVLDDQLWIDWEKVSDAPEGDPKDGPDADVLGSIEMDGGHLPVRMVRSADGQWLLGPGIVAVTPELYGLYGPGWLGDHLPSVMFSLRLLEIQAWQWIGLLVAFLLALLFARFFSAALQRLALHLASRTRTRWDDRVVLAAAGPARMILGIAAFYVIERWLRLALPAREELDRLLRVFVIATLTWAALRGLSLLAEFMAERFVGERERLSARGAMTQIMVLKRVLGVVALFVGAALTLVQFDGMRAVGTSLLASAGVAGLVVGLAAQRSIGTLLAGIQISLTQPIRVGDVVVIESEWGTIEEITLTYVVVKVWDLRRLIVPITKILEAPFQNWTRSNAEILGTVFLHADYGAPVATLRAEVERFAKTCSEWDGKVAGLQVTGATERTVELRAVVSSADASKNWDLRCALREHLIGFLRQLEGGRYLPRTRIDGLLVPEARLDREARLPALVSRETEPTAG